MKVLVTGGSGIVGRFIIHNLLEKGFEVHALCRNPEKASVKFKADIENLKWIKGDILDVFSLEEALKEIDFVIHAAGLVSFDPKDRDLLMKINREGTANVVNACLNHSGIKKLVHISSVSCLSPSKPMPSEIDERQGFNPDRTSSDYAVSKYAAEMEVCRGVEEGLSAVMVNPSIVLAPGKEGESSAALVAYAMKPRIFQPPGWLNYVDARDLAEVVVRLLEEGPREGNRMVISSGHIPYPDFFSKIASKVGIRPPLFITGPILTGLAWRFAGLISAITGKKPLLTRFTAASSSKKFIYKGIALENALGKFQFRSIEESLTWIIEENG